MAQMPNIAAPEAPAGGEDDYVVLEHVGTPRDFAAEGFEPLDHVELGKLLGAIDIERGAKVSGARFYYLTGVGADLELALVNMAMDQARECGLHADDPAGAGQAAGDGGHRLPRPGRRRRLPPPADDLYLVGTSEVPLAAYHSDEILDAETLPRRYAAFSPCFRREAGSYGKDTRGIIRVHWFDKVEMFVYTTLEESYKEHERLLGWEKEWLDKLELPYRVIDTAAGDLGLSAQPQVRLRGVDPDPGRYRELTSTSNCTEFQARRLNIRVPRRRTGIKPVATLNGTLMRHAPATIVAILENHQQADGSVRVPRRCSLTCTAGRRSSRSRDRHLVGAQVTPDWSRSTSTARWSTSTGRASAGRASTRSWRASAPARTSCCPPAGRCFGIDAGARRARAHRRVRRREQRCGDVRLPPGRRCRTALTFDPEPAVRTVLDAGPGRAGRGRGDRARLPHQQALPRGRDQR